MIKSNYLTLEQRLTRLEHLIANEGIFDKLKEKISGKSSNDSPEDTKVKVIKALVSRVLDVQMSLNNSMSDLIKWTSYKPDKKLYPEGDAKDDFNVSEQSGNLVIHASGQTRMMTKNKLDKDYITISFIVSDVDDQISNKSVNVEYELSVGGKKFKRETIDGDVVLSKFNQSLAKKMGKQLNELYYTVYHTILDR